MTTISQLLHSIRPEFDFIQSQAFIDEGMLDSFDMVTLVSSIDTRYNISVEGVDIVPENFQSLETIEALLRKYGVHL